MTKKDLRVIKTLKSIDDAIIALLKDKKFEDITVKDICEKAMINRGTYYSHYKDKYALIQSYQKSLIEDAESLIYKNITGDSLTEIADHQIKDMLEQLFEYIEYNQMKIYATALAVGRVEFMEDFSKHMYKIYRLKQKELGVHFSDEALSEYLITYVSNAHLGIIYRWLENGCKETPKEMAEMLELMTITGVFKTVLTKEKDE